MIEGFVPFPNETPNEKSIEVSQVKSVKCSSSVFSWLTRCCVFIFNLLQPPGFTFWILLDVSSICFVGSSLMFRWPINSQKCKITYVIFDRFSFALFSSILLDLKKKARLAKNNQKMVSLLNKNESS